MHIGHSRSLSSFASSIAAAALAVATTPAAAASIIPEDDTAGAAGGDALNSGFTTEGTSAPTDDSPIEETLRIGAMRSGIKRGVSARRERYSVKLRMLSDDPVATKNWPSTVDKHSNIFVSSARNSVFGMCTGNFQGKKVDMKAQVSHQVNQRKEAFGGSDPQHSLTQSGLAIARKKRVHTQFNELQECYLQKRRLGANQLHRQEEKDINVISREGYHPGLEDFQSVLTTFTRYSRLRVIAELRHGDLFHSANIVSSIEFDRDDELFATAGVSKRIEVFEFSTVLNEPSDVHCPVLEMSTRSKLSCLSWNKYSKNIIASSDYEGIVTVWDVTTRQSVMEYEEQG